MLKWPTSILETNPYGQNQPLMPHPATAFLRLARMFRLSRSTLLYYDRIGLLRPSERTGANYRVYSEADRQRLDQICRYRRTGMSLETIAAVLAAPRQKRSWPWSGGWMP
jgi:hypothetical protein